MPTLHQIIDRLRSPYADYIYIAPYYTKADLIADLSAIAERDGAGAVNRRPLTEENPYYQEAALASNDNPIADDAA